MFCTQSAAPQASGQKIAEAACSPPGGHHGPAPKALGGLLAGTHGALDGRQRKRFMCAFPWAESQLAGEPGGCGWGQGLWGRGGGRCSKGAAHAASYEP